VRDHKDCIRLPSKQLRASPARQRCFWILITFVILLTKDLLGALQVLSDNIPLSAPVDTESAGKGGDVATSSVFRVICRKDNSIEAGTGFFHKSGRVITAQHVADGCSQISVINPKGIEIKASVLASNTDLDLAILSTETPMTGKALEITNLDNNKFLIGTQVSTWGFPGGYNGLNPILSVGYLSGLQAFKAKSGRIVRQWIVNAAFNRGNSGGPVLHIETGQVIGVVSSKIAPISKTAAQALELLSKQGSVGIMYPATRPDGTQIHFSEGQIVAMVLDELRKQVQLVIGQAALPEDLRNFLKEQKIDP
jgi:S1-C subfamily serine protease